MHLTITTLILFIILLEIYTQKDPDEGRPYEFSFTIDGEQHRKEKKDERGIIQGEFGFITADGIYHVTAYATDENGSFKILSMKNIRLSGPLDQNGKSGKYQVQKPALKLSSSTARAFTGFSTEPTIKPGCGGCGIVTKSPNQQGKFQSIFNTKQVSGSTLAPNILPNQTPQDVTKTKESNNGYRNPLKLEEVEVFGQPQEKQNKDNSVTSKPKEALAKLAKIENNVIRVPGNPDIPIKDKYPGMQPGLPNGVEEKDLTDILYKFKYTVGFHGHYEKGLKNGTKIGGYFVNGRDGISRIVTYVADENGYRPKFKLVNLGLDSADTPKEENEKTFGLKEFEFVWYPILYDQVRSVTLCAENRKR